MRMANPCFWFPLERISSFNGVSCFLPAIETWGRLDFCWWNSDADVCNLHQLLFLIVGSLGVITLSFLPLFFEHTDCSSQVFVWRRRMATGIRYLDIVGISWHSEHYLNLVGNFYHHQQSRLAHPTRLLLSRKLQRSSKILMAAGFLSQSPWNPWWCLTRRIYLLTWPLFRQLSHQPPSKICSYSWKIRGRCLGDVIKIEIVGLNMFNQLITIRWIPNNLKGEAQCWSSFFGGWKNDVRKASCFCFG